MTDKQKRLAEKNNTMPEVYGDLVNKKIRLRYSLSAELATLRQRDEKPDEYAAYNAYVEQCKAEAKAEIGTEEGESDENTDVQEQ